MTAVRTGAAVRTGWLVRFGAAWLGIWLAQLTVIQLLLPEQVAAALPADSPVDEVVAFGRVSAVAGVVALVVLPVVGMLSDRTRSRLGRRRPWAAAGVGLFAIGLLVLGSQRSLAGVAVGWALALAGFAAVSTALTAVIADQVPVERRGVVSAVVSAPQAGGLVLGLVVIEALGLPRAGSYAVVAVLLVLLALPLLLRMPDPPLPPGPPPAAVRRTRHPDFAWTLGGRLLVNLGNAVGTTLLLSFLADGLRMPDPAGALLPLVLVYLALLLVATIVCGRISDVLGRRRPFVAAAAGLQALAAVVLAAAPAYGPALVAAALLGAGYGVFLSVDQALATQVLPDPARTGRDSGLMTAAAAVPQALGPIVGAGVVAVTGGFPALFTVAAALSAAGALAVARVRGVR